MLQNKSIAIAIVLLITCGSFASENPRARVVLPTPIPSSHKTIEKDSVKESNEYATQMQGTQASSSSSATVATAVVQPLVTKTKIRKSMQCPKCNKIFESSFGFKYHINHPKACNPLEQSNQEKEKEIAAMVQKSKVLPNKQFECFACKKILCCGSAAIENHIRSVHIRTNAYKCDTCATAFPHEKALNTHKKTAKHLKKAQEDDSAAAKQRPEPIAIQKKPKAGSKRNSDFAATDDTSSLDDGREVNTTSDEGDEDYDPSLNQEQSDKMDENNPAKRRKYAESQNGSAGAQITQSTPSQSFEQPQHPTEQILAAALKIALKASLKNRRAAIVKLKQDLIQTILEESEKRDNGNICIMCDKHIKGDADSLKVHAISEHAE